MRILVVDDDKAVRDSLRRSLVFNGYQVDLAEDGKEALLAHDRLAPDALVLDVMMPRRNGLDVCRELRAHGSVTPVLLLTARDSAADRTAGYAAGADAYLAKPFALEDLLAGLRSLLGDPRPAAAAV